MKKAGAGPHGGEPASAFDGAAARRRLPFQPEHITPATTSVGSGAVGGLPETAVKWTEEEESPPACAGKSAARRHEPLADGNYPRIRGEESNENADSDGMTIPSESGFSALFQEPPPGAARFQGAGPGAIRLSSLMPWHTLCVPEPNRQRPSFLIEWLMQASISLSGRPLSRNRSRIWSRP